MAALDRPLPAGTTLAPTRRWSEYTLLSRQVKQAGLLELAGEQGVLAPAALARWQAGGQRLIESGHEGSSGRRWNGGPGPGALRTAAALTGSAT